MSAPTPTIPDAAPPWLRHILERLNDVYNVAMASAEDAAAARKDAQALISIDAQLGRIAAELSEVTAQLARIEGELTREMTARRDEDIAQRKSLGELQRRVVARHSGAGAAAGGAVLALVELVQLIAARFF